MVAVDNPSAALGLPAGNQAYLAEVPGATGQWQYEHWGRA